jgi:hypothetical protein
MDSTNSTHTHTTQLFFPQEINDAVALRAPYNVSSLYRVKNAEDEQFVGMKNVSVARVEWDGVGKLKAELAVGIDRWW